MRWRAARRPEGIVENLLGLPDFIERFYRHWLGQAGRSDPAAAFRTAQLESMAAPPDDNATRRDRTWTQFVMVGE